MKNVLIRLFSTITILTLLVISSFGQTLSKVEFDEIIDEMICSFTDLSLKEQRGQPHYKKFENEIKVNCSYYTVRPFLRELTPVPSKTLEIVNLLHDHYKERYNLKATNQQLHNITTGVFEENTVIAFSQNHPNSFPSFKTDWQGELRQRFMLNVQQKDAIIEDTLPLSAVESEYNDIVDEQSYSRENEVKSPTDFTTDPNEELYSSNGLGNSFLLFGFGFLLLAFALYFLYQRNKGAINKRLTRIKTPKPKAPKPTQPKPQTKQKTKAKGTNNWFNSKPKKETYAERIATFQTLIQTQKSTLIDLKDEISKMHHQISDLTEKAGFEVIDEHIKQLSQKLDEVEQKQKELILVLDDQLETEETNADEYEDTNDIYEEEEWQKDPFEDLQTKTATDILTVEEVTESNFSNEIPVIQVKKLNSPPDLFFMPIPNKDGSFDVENWTAKFEDTESVYRFEMINNYEAKFQFYNEKKTVKRAISGYDIYVKPVCKALNAFNTNATEIRTQVHGVVYRDGNTWKLKEKALVYYQ